MNSEIYYHEEWEAPRWGVLILLSIIGLITGLLLYQVGTGVIVGLNPAPNEILLIIDLLLIGIYATFRKMEISLTSDGVILGYNWIEHHLDYSDIASVEESKAELFKVGGVGIKYMSNGEKAYTNRLGDALRINMKKGRPLLITPRDSKKVREALSLLIS
jgi:hypothetical protein